MTNSRVKLGLSVAVKRGELLGLVELAEDGELGWRFRVRQSTGTLTASDMGGAALDISSSTHSLALRAASQDSSATRTDRSRISVQRAHVRARHLAGGEWPIRLGSKGQHSGRSSCSAPRAQN